MEKESQTWRQKNIEQYRKYQREYQREYQKKYQKQYYLENKEQILQNAKKHQKQYYLKNKEQIIQKAKEHYKQNKEQILQNAKQHYKQNKEKYKESYHKKAIIFKNWRNTLSCKLCNASDKLHFHHVDPTTKTSEVTTFAANHKKLTEELKLCVCVCNECHKKIHKENIVIDIDPTLVTSWTDYITTATNN